MFVEAQIVTKQIVIHDTIPFSFCRRLHKEGDAGQTCGISRLREEFAQMRQLDVGANALIYIGIWIDIVWGAGLIV